MLQPSQARFICTTADCWSTRRKSFLGVTVHWLNNDLKRKSACLAIRRVVGKCDYEVLAKLLEFIHEEFEITAKIIATVTDSGSNFVKAFCLFATNPTISTSSNDEPQQLPDVMGQATSAYSSHLSDSECEEEDSEYCCIFLSFNSSARSGCQNHPVAETHFSLPVSSSSCRLSFLFILYLLLTDITL